MKDHTYYGINIYAFPEVNHYGFCVGGWCFEVETLEEAKKEIKQWKASGSKDCKDHGFIENEDAGRDWL